MFIIFKKKFNNTEFNSHDWQFNRNCRSFCIGVRNEKWLRKFCKIREYKCTICNTLAHITYECFYVYTAFDKRRYGRCSFEIRPGLIGCSEAMMRKACE